jgi:hypothetical protein
MGDDVIFTGIPTMCLLPLNNTKFKVVNEVYLSVPREGVYKKLAPEIFNDSDGEFKLLTEGNALYLPAITKILLALGKYPSLETNQVFAPSILLFEDDVVIIEGAILEILSIVQ